MFNVQAKKILAKLLAMENLTVVHSGTHTATFDLIRRILTLPLWKNISEDVYDLLVLHEISHALHTPQGSKCLAEACQRIDPVHPWAGKRVLNVVEDCRIEKLIKIMYPGGRAAFIRGYKELVEQNRFGTQNKDINKFGIIDRINIYFKTGNTDIRFSEDEQEFVEEIKKVLLFDQVVDISKRLYEFAKQERDCKNLEDNSESEESDRSEIERDFRTKSRRGSSDEEEKEIVDPDGNNCVEEDEINVESDNEQGNCSEGPEAGETAKDQENGKTAKDEENLENKKDNSDPIVSITDEAWEKSKEELVDKNAVPVVYLGIPVPILGKIIFHHKIVHREIRQFYETQDMKNSSDDIKQHTSEFERFKQENKPIIDWLIKEFDVHKSADEFSRIQISKTGILDLNKLSQYKFTTDLMRKVAKVPTGQNHSLKIFIDWSASMENHALGTIHQLLNLAIFARKKQIPFQAYLFGMNETHSRETIYTRGAFSNNEAFNHQKEDFAFFEGFSLKEILSGNMSALEFQEACVNLLLMASGAAKGCKFTKGITYPGLPPNFCMGGTTINETIVSAVEMISHMKEQIVNVVFITDGEATTDHRYVNSNVGSCSVMDYKKSEYILRDLVTRMDYPLNENSFDTTKQFLSILKTRSNVNIIGFYIAKRGAIEEVINKFEIDKDFDSIEKELDQNNFFVIPDKGYDEFYLIQGGERLRINISTNTLVSAVGNSQMVTCLAQRGIEQRKQRIVLTKFIKMIS